MDNKDINGTVMQPQQPSQAPTNPETQNNFQLNQQLPKEETLPKMEKEVMPQVEIPKEVREETDANSTIGIEQTPQNTEMPKKESTVQFNNQEQVLYNVEQEKEGNPLVVILFMLALCAFVFFLPTISKKTNDLMKSNSPSNNQPVISPIEEEEKNKQLNFHEKGTIGNLELTNLVKSYENGNYELDFTLINTGESAYTFDKKYYIVLYDTEKIVYRALLHSYTPLASKASIELSLTINEKAYKDAITYQIQEINTSMYPVVTLNKKEEDFDVLTCTYRFNKIDYYFKEDTLMKIKDETTISMNDNVNYTLELLNYQALASVYKNVSEMNATLVENPTDFKLINEFNLADIKDTELSNLKVYKYFRFREIVDIIAFEMETQGYTCS